MIFVDAYACQRSSVFLLLGGPILLSILSSHPG